MPPDERQRRSGRPARRDFNGDTEIGFTRDLTVRDVALRQDFAYGASGRHLIEGGFEAHALDTAVGGTGSTCTLRGAPFRPTHV